MLLALILLTFSGETFGQDDTNICSKPFLETCPNNFPLPFPESSVELKEACSEMLIVLPCLQNYVMECKENDAEEIDKDLIYLKDVCDEDSKTHKDVVQHLFCIKEVARVSLDMCVNFTEEFIETNRERILSKDWKSNDSYTSPQEVCLKSLHLLTCFLTLYEENCENGVVDVVLDAYHRTSYISNACEKEIEDELQSFVETLETDFENKYLLRLLRNTFKS